MGAKTFGKQYAASYFMIIGCSDSSSKLVLECFVCYYLSGVCQPLSAAGRLKSALLL